MMSENMMSTHTTKFDTLITNAIILTGDKGYEPFRGSIGISNGVIAEVFCGPAPMHCAAEHIDASGKALMPGLINGHCHGDMTLAKGMGDGMTLREQIDAFAWHNWFYDFITDDDRYDSRQLTYAEALLSGTTFLLENMYWSLGARSARAMSEMGIHGALAEDIRRNFNRPDVFIDEKEIERFLSSCTEQGLVPVIALPAEEDFEPGLMERAAAQLRGFDVRKTFHFSETEWRRDIVKERFGVTSAAFLDKAGLFDEFSIASHSVHLTPEDIKRMAASGVKVVNTPLAEMKIADGIAPLADMRAEGVTVGLGTDGPLWNNTSDIFREMKGASLINAMHKGVRRLDKKALLDMATISGAAVFGLEKKYGTVEKGKCADLILIDLSAPHLQPIRLGSYENVTSAIVFGATGGDVTDVFISGKRVVKNRELLTADVSKIAARVRDASDRIAERLIQNHDCANVSLPEHDASKPHNKTTSK
jgi:5-methylthioadenosine/S-adenosylhomocysteine deaminase